MATEFLLVGTVPEQSLTLYGVGWDQYVAVGDALPERANLRMIYTEGRLTLRTRSLLQCRIAERLGLLITIVAASSGLECEPAGSATFRRDDADAGAEGDKTYYFGPNAERMRGPRDVDLATDPPPDLAVEVEAAYPADEALRVWGRLGVPEVWRFDAGGRTLAIWHRRSDGSYARAERSAVLPAMEPREVVEHVGIVDAVGMSRWASDLMEWVRDVLVPRGR